MSHDSTHYVFSYGTLKRGEPNHMAMKDGEHGACKLVGCGETVDKYPLVVGTVYNCPFLMKLENQGHIIRGELYEVDNEKLLYLDKLEKHPKVYRRQQIDIHLTEDTDGNPWSPPQIYKCWVYFFHEVREEMVQLKWISEYHSKSEDYPEYVRVRDRNIPLLNILFPNET